MNNPKRQHYVPQVYLRNFTIPDSPEFVQLALKEPPHSSFKTGIKNICVEKDLYTIIDEQGEKNYMIENFYADYIESNYNEVYQLLTDQAVTQISFDQKYKIILVILSFYFRNPKILEQHNQLMKSIFEEVASRNSDENEMIRFDFEGTSYEFKQNEISQVLKFEREQAREQLALSSIGFFNTFIKARMRSEILVHHVADEFELVTSDCPLIIRAPKNDEPFYLLDPRNYIQLPLSPKYAVTIMPTEHDSDILRINRQESDWVNSLTLNHSVRTNAIKFIIGNENSVRKSLELEDKFENTSLGQETFDKTKRKAEKLHRYFEIVKSKDGNFGDPVALIEFVKIYKDPDFEDDPMIKHFISQLKEKGLFA